MAAAFGYGRLRDLGAMPDLLRSLAGEDGLNRAFREQDLPLTLLATPDAAVPMRDIVALYHRAAGMSGLRSLGLVSGSDIDLSLHGDMGRYVMQARNLPGAFERLRAALPYYETGSRIEIGAEGNEVRIGYRTIYQDMVGWRHAGDFALCLIADLLTGYLGDGWRPRRIETCYDKGRWILDHEVHFATPVRPGSDRVAIILDRETVRPGARKRAMGTDWLVSFGDVRRLGETLPRDFPQTVMNIVERRLITRSTDLDGAAAMLGLGPRTLQRRLADSGLGYRDLVLRCRMRRARELLGEADNTVGQIARSLGYASTPQFTRAFKSNLGITPEAYRQSHPCPIPRVS